MARGAEHLRQLGCGRTAGGFFGHAPSRRGDGTKGWLQGTIVGRLVTVPGSRQAHTELPVSAPGQAGPCSPFSPLCLLFAPLPTPRLTPCSPLPTWLPGWGILTKLWFPADPLPHQARGRLLLEAELRPCTTPLASLGHQKRSDGVVLLPLCSFGVS